MKKFRDNIEKKKQKKKESKWINGESDKRIKILFR